MRLLAVYIRKYKKIYENQMINFNGDIAVKYENNDLKIEKIEKHPQKYGENLLYISAIIGKNGSGKTTLLNLIGDDNKNRVRKMTFQGNYPEDQYFLVYEMNQDEYYMEVFGKFKFNNITFKEDQEFEYFNKVCFRVEGNTYKSEKENLENTLIIYSHEDKKIYDSDLIYSVNTRLGHSIERDNAGVFSLHKCYEIYHQLYSKGIIESPELNVVFRTEFNSSNYKKENFNEPLDFMMHSMGNVNCSSDTMFEGKIYCFAEELFQNFLGHHLAESLKTIDSFSKNEIGGYKFSEFRERYTKNEIIWTDEEVIKFYDEFRNLGYDDVSDLIKLFLDMFVKLLKIQKYIIPQIDQFILQLNGMKLNKDILSFAEAYDKLKKTIDSKQMDTKWVDLQSVILASTGEIKIISMISNIEASIKQEMENISLINMRLKKPCHIIALIDEIDRDMHLEWTRNLINFFVNYFEQDKFDLVELQLIFTTHTPYLLSDLYRGSIQYLEKENGLVQVKTGQNTFAENIHNILYHNFKIEGCYGKYAENKLNKIIEWLNSEEKNVLCHEEWNEYKKVIDQVGEDVLRKKLQMMFNEKLYGTSEKSKLSDEISEIVMQDDMPKEMKKEKIKVVLRNYNLE